MGMAGSCVTIGARVVFRPDRRRAPYDALLAELLGVGICAGCRGRPLLSAVAFGSARVNGCGVTEDLRTVVALEIKVAPRIAARPALTFR